MALLLNVIMCIVVLFLLYHVHYEYPFIISRKRNVDVITRILTNTFVNQCERNFQVLVVSKKGSDNFK